MTNKITKNCHRHGETLHSLRTDGRYRCLKCQTLYVHQKRQKTKRDAIAYKGGCCNLCGYNKCVAALEFHHLDPLFKEFEICSSLHNKSAETMQKELDKCILLCANCHREEHERLRIVD